MSREVLKRSVWIRVALLNAELSTCLRLNVGCVLLDDKGKVIGTGYNGSLSGRVHCKPETCNPEKRCLWTQHAERNALDISTREVFSAFVTHEPCLQCTKDLLSKGCKNVYFLQPYSMKEDEAYWRNQHAYAGNMNIFQINEMGLITKEVIWVSRSQVIENFQMANKTIKKCDHNWVYDGLGGGHEGKYYHNCSKCHERDWFSDAR